MTYLIAIGAAAGCAVANGVSAVLQKVGADKVDRADSLRPSLLLKLSRSLPYLTGILLDLVGWLLLLAAVRVLPLFLAQAIIAASVVVAAFVDKVVLRTQLSQKMYAAIGIVLTGLVLVALSASPQASHGVSHLVRLSVIFAPLLVLLLGAALSRSRRQAATVGLAALGGIAFGATSVAGRMLPGSLHPASLIRDGLVWALVAYGLLGLLLFTTALQRASATSMNAIMISFDTLVPAIFGIVFLGDTARHGMWPIALTGAVVTLGGAIIIAIQSSPDKIKSPSVD